MKITDIETFAVGAGWKNWLFVRVHTDERHPRHRRGHAERLHQDHRSRRARARSISPSARIRAASMRWPSACSTACRSTAAISTAP